MKMDTPEEKRTVGQEDSNILRWRLVPVHVLLTLQLSKIFQPTADFPGPGDKSVSSL